MGSKIKAIQILQAAGYILLGLFLVLKPDTCAGDLLWLRRDCGGIRTSACAPVPER